MTPAAVADRNTDRTVEIWFIIILKPQQLRTVIKHDDLIIYSFIRRVNCVPQHIAISVSDRFPQTINSNHDLSGRIPPVALQKRKIAIIEIQVEKIVCNITGLSTGTMYVVVCYIEKTTFLIVTSPESGYIHRSE